MSEANRHLPYAAAIEAYGKGGFRFADMSHRGSLIVSAPRHLGVARESGGGG